MLCTLIMHAAPNQSKREVHISFFIIHGLLSTWHNPILFIKTFNKESITSKGKGNVVFHCVFEAHLLAELYSVVLQGKHVI